MKPIPSPSLEAVAHSFSSWRQSRVSKKEPIPESLRTMAIALKNSYPVGQIKAALNINSKMLKCWSNDHAAAPSLQFLSLPPADTIRDKTSPTVKLEYPSGICLSVTGGLTHDALLSLVRSLSVAVSS